MFEAKDWIVMGVCVGSAAISAVCAIASRAFACDAMNAATTAEEESLSTETSLILCRETAFKAEASARAAESWVKAAATRPGGVKIYADGTAEFEIGGEG